MLGVLRTLGRNETNRSWFTYLFLARTGFSSRELRDLFDRTVGAGQGLRRQWEDPRNAVRGEWAQRPMSVVVRCVLVEYGRQLPFADGGPLPQWAGRRRTGRRAAAVRFAPPADGYQPRSQYESVHSGSQSHDGANPVTLVTAPRWVGTRCAGSVARSRPPAGVDHPDHLRA